MRLVFLGTAGARPTARRGLPCACLVTDGGDVLVFDAGEGAQFAYLRSGLGWNKRMRVFITHMHGDHCLGLAGLLQTMGLQGRTEPVEVRGPAGIREFVGENARMLNHRPPFPLEVGEVGGAGESRCCAGDGYWVSARPADHTVPALSYLFVERDRPGRFYPERAARLGVPKGPMWKALQSGAAVTLEDGRSVGPREVAGPPRPGRRIGVSGDTRPTAELAAFFRGCDLLVFDSTFAEEMAERAAETGHTTAAGAARLAKDAGAKNLVLTHFSSRYPDAAALAEEAAKIHGSVRAAEDMMVVEM